MDKKGQPNRKADRQMTIRFSFERSNHQEAWEIIQSKPSGARNEYIMDVLARAGRRDVEDAAYRSLQRALNEYQFQAAPLSDRQVPISHEAEILNKNDEAMQNAMAYILSLD